MQEFTNNRSYAMKYVFAVMFIWLASQAAIGQSVVHDYAVISYRPHPSVRELIIDVSGQERQDINLRAVKGKDLSMVPLDVQTVLAKVQEFESQGWILVSFNSFAPAESYNEKWIWLLKRKKTL